MITSNIKASTPVPIPQTRVCSYSIPKSRTGYRLLEEYNGNQNQNTAHEIALLMSQHDVPLESSELFLQFVDALKDNKLDVAYKIYKQACTDPSDAVELIHKILDTIPIRVSCEYYSSNPRRFEWLNCWVKIGWWSEEEVEISPQLQNGYWTSKIEGVSAIDTNEFKCVVWETTNYQTILSIMNCVSIMSSSGLPTTQTNVELKFINGFWVPIRVAFKEPSSSTNHLDLAKIEMGSIDKVENLDQVNKPVDKLDKPVNKSITGYNLDSLRKHVGSVVTPEGIFRYYSGSTFGDLFHERRLDYSSESDEYFY